MKLKKIVSLALAGILAVSMLAGCKDNGGNDDSASSNQPSVSSGYTDTILEKTKAATKLVLSASSNDKLDKAVEYAAKNDHGKADNTLAYVGKTEAYYTLASDVMTGNNVIYADNGGEANLPGKVNAMTSDGTAYVLFKVSRMMDDEWITNEVVDLVETWADALNEDADDMTYAYTIRVAKADSLAGKEADRADDTVVVGVAITVDQTKVEY